MGKICEVQAPPSASSERIRTERVAAIDVTACAPVLRTKGFLSRWTEPSDSRRGCRAPDGDLVATKSWPTCCPTASTQSGRAPVDGSKVFMSSRIQCATLMTTYDFFGFFDAFLGLLDPVSNWISRPIPPSRITPFLT